MSTNSQSKTLVYDLYAYQIEELFSSWGEPAYRGNQFWHGLYRQYYQQPEEFTTLPRSLRARLDSELSFKHLTPDTVLFSSDGETKKIAYRLPDGSLIESVLMNYASRRTLCISTQAGCGMGCVFCATGQMGLKRNLTSGEIVEQVIDSARNLHNIGEKISNIVFMGMGEPFHNYDHTMRAIDLLNHKEGLNFGARRLTISTVGVVPAILKFSSERRQVNLAVSLHAVNDDLRSSMMPINKKYPVDTLLHACKRYVQETGRRISFEWALIDDLNDSLEHARNLAHKMELFKFENSNLSHVNIIPLNPTPGYHESASSNNKASAFLNELVKCGVSCTIRQRRGIDIHAGCGQLATKLSDR